MTQIMLFLVAAAVAQDFDAAIVKRDLDPVVQGKISRGSGTFRMVGGTMSLAIRWAWKLQTYQLDGPDWINWDSSNLMPRFDIAAKFGSDASDDDVREMLKRLLADQMKLVVRQESRELDSWVVRASKKGARVEFVEGGPVEPTYVVRQGPRSGELEWVLENTTARELCDALSASLKRPAIDETGFADRRFGARVVLRQDPGNPRDLEGPLLEALGDVGIVATRAVRRVDVLVVEHISKNPAND